MDSEFISEYFDALHDYALRKCGELDLAGELVQDTMEAALVYLSKGGTIENPASFLKTVLNRRYNQYLREKYRNRTDYSDRMDMLSERRTEERFPEYEAVRREVSRLQTMYREVIVRHYMRGQSVETIASEMNIPKGTVLTRLHQGRNRIKDGMTSSMEKYTQSSYDPKWVRMGISGGTSYKGEPFNLVNSLITQNILIEAYEKPLSVQALADKMGVACVYIEEFVNRLIQGELMGRTLGGLVYTRCFLIPASKDKGDIPAQEKCAKENIDRIWSVFSAEFAPMKETASWKALRPKQQIILTISTLQRVLSETAWSFSDSAKYENYPERPNGGKWYAIGTVFDHDEKIPARYDSSGPLHQHSASLPREVYMTDFQSAFGDAHWIYSRDSEQVLQLYYSLIPPQTSPLNASLVEMIPELKAHHILTEDETGAAILDIPYITTEDDAVLGGCISRMTDRLKIELTEPLQKLIADTVHDIPDYVDGREDFLHYGATGAFALACCYEAVESGKLPCSYKIGELPLIVVRYPGK